MCIYLIQKAVATATDELLEITRGISRLAEGYGRTDWVLSS